MKYSLEEIKQMLLEPSFDSNFDEGQINRIVIEIEEAIAYHEKLNKSNNGEGFEDLELGI